MSPARSASTAALAPAGPAVLGGVEGIYGIDELPLRWAAGESGSAG